MSSFWVFWGAEESKNYLLLFVSGELLLVLRLHVEREGHFYCLFSHYLHILEEDKIANHNNFDEEVGQDETDSQYSVADNSYMLKTKYSEDNKHSTAKFTFTEDEKSPLLGRKSKD